MLPIQQNVQPMLVNISMEDNNNNAKEELYLASYIVENPMLDLEVYANSYTGLGKLKRLVYIADHCPSLRIEALKMAITYVMTTFNTEFYIMLHRKLKNAVDASGPSDVAATSQQESTPQDIPTMDQTWIETQSKRAIVMEYNLKEDNFIGDPAFDWENIQRNLGDHYLNCGDLIQALKCYLKAQDECNDNKYAVNMYLNIIKVSIYLRKWSDVLRYVTKIERISELAPDFMKMNGKDNNQAIITKLKVAAGLAELAMRMYKMAAKYFLQASLDHCDCPELLSPGNVTVYGGLCALATFNRSELQNQVILSNSFKGFLELEPQIRDIIFNFYELKYASCLKLLDEIKDNILLDMYIGPLVNSLYLRIRNKALIQYFSPYRSADMRLMATTFNRTVFELEDELLQLILNGQIQARIDLHNKVLYAKDVDERNTTFKTCISVGKNYQRRTRILILRAVIKKHQIRV